MSAENNPFGIPGYVQECQSEQAKKFIENNPTFGMNTMLQPLSDEQEDKIFKEVIMEHSKKQRLQERFMFEKNITKGAFSSYKWQLHYIEWLQDLVLAHENMDNAEYQAKQDGGGI